MRRRKQEEHVVDVEMQCDMLFILSALCENDVHRKVWNGVLCDVFYCFIFFKL